jgi:glutathione S-transferase
MLVGRGKHDGREEGNRMNLTLFYAPVACSAVPYITLTEAGANFDVHSINLQKDGTRTPEFLRINPKHKVPVLVVDGEPLSENIAIQIWINRQFPHANLLPKDPWQEVKAISTMAFCASGIHPHLTPNARPQNYCDLPGSEEGVKRASKKMLLEDFRIAEGMLASREWFFSHFTACDAYFFWCVRRALSFELDLSAYGSCMAHFERMQQRPSVRKLISYERAVQEEFSQAA